MEEISDGTVPGVGITGIIYGTPYVIPGHLGNGIYLHNFSFENGNFIDFGSHIDQCFDNLQLCSKGLTVALWFRQESQTSSQPYHLPMFDTSTYQIKTVTKDNALYVRVKYSSYHPQTNIGPYVMKGGIAYFKYCICNCLYKISSTILNQLIPPHMWCMVPPEDV